jgi:GT2 family glycosyltransferase
MERLPDLLEALASLGQQTYPNIEIIFVAEGFRELCERVRDFAQERGLADLNVVFNSRPSGLSAARNLGIHYSRGEIIAFIDNDAVADKDWAEQIVRTFVSDSEAVGVTGQAVPLWMDEGMGWFPEEFDWILGCSRFMGVRELEPVRSTLGANMAFRSTVFQQTSGFSQHLGGIQGKRLHGEEVEFCLRVRSKTGKHILYNPEVRVMHKVYVRRLSLRWISRTCYWIGFTRGVLQSVSQQYGIQEDFLAVERRLLGRILRRLLPRTLIGLSTDPIAAWCTFRLMFEALLFVGLGYTHYILLRVMGRVDPNPNQLGTDA